MDIKHKDQNNFKQWVIENANINKINPNIAEIQYYFYFVINLIKDVLQSENIPLNNENLNSKTIVINGSKLKKKQTLDDFNFICVYLQKKLLENDLLSFYEKQQHKNLNILNFVCQYVSVLDDQPQSFSVVFIGSDTNRPSSSTGSSGGVARIDPLEQSIINDKELTALIDDLLAGSGFVAKMGKGALGSLLSAAGTVGKNLSGLSAKALSSAKSVLNTVFNDKSGKISSKITSKPEFQKAGQQKQTNDKKPFGLTNEQLNGLKAHKTVADTIKTGTNLLADAANDKTKQETKTNKTLPNSACIVNDNKVTEDQLKQIRARAEARKQRLETKKQELIKKGVSPDKFAPNRCYYNELIGLVKKYGSERIEEDMKKFGPERLNNMAQKLKAANLFQTPDTPQQGQTPANPTPETKTK